MHRQAKQAEKEFRSTLPKRPDQKRRSFEDVLLGNEVHDSLRIHGIKATIHADVTISRTAEDANVLTCWQGNSELTIDRFDIRTQMDVIPEKVSDLGPLSDQEFKEQLVCAYESYRLIVLNEFRDTKEDEALERIAEFDTFLESERKTTKKRNSGRQQPGFHYSYEDSEDVAGPSQQTERSFADFDEDSNIRQLKHDAASISHDAESQRRANRIGEHYGIMENHFAVLFKGELEALEQQVELRRLEREKLKIGGKEGKGERKELRLRQKELIGKNPTEQGLIPLSSFRDKKKEEKKVTMESSSSSDETPQCIISFPDDEKVKTRRRSDKKRSRWDRSRSGERTRSRSPRRSSRSPRQRRHSSNSDRPGSATKLEREKTPTSSDTEGDLELLEIRSSLSESEQERRQIENRKRRVKLTKRKVKEQKERRKDSGRKETKEAELVKRKMKKTLEKTVDELREEDNIRRRERHREKEVCEEERQRAERERRERERKRHHHEYKESERDDRNEEQKGHSHDVKKRRRRSSSISDYRRSHKSYKH